MLERFHVPADIAVHVMPDDMFATVTDIFLKMGMSEEDAKQSADVLVYADVRGIESHGVSNMLRRYVEQLQSGGINPNPKIRVVREMPAAATIVVGPMAMNMAIERAKQYGIGTVTAMNGRHFGACAYHASMALKHNMVGLAMTTGGLNVLPVHGSKPLVGLNPIGVAAPTKNEPPFIFDASMSSVAGNKIALAQRIGVPVMPGWIADGEGNPIMEEQMVPEKWAMLPSGATRELGAHKGYSLAVMVEILCGILGGTGAGTHRTQGAAHHFIAYNIEAFTDVNSFKEMMDEYMRELQDSPTAPGHDRVVYAGLPEHEEEIERREHGIPYHPEVIDWFKATCGELDIEWRLTKE